MGPRRPVDPAAAPPARRPPPRRTTPPRTTTTAPPRRGITAEQLVAMCDEAFKAKQYDDALEAYQKAVAMKPIMSAYYHIGGSRTIKKTMTRR